MTPKEEIMALVTNLDDRPVPSVTWVDRADVLPIVERLDAKRKLAREALFDLARGARSQWDYANKILAETAEDE